jgi:hypothetical protein
MNHLFKQMEIEIDTQCPICLETLADPVEQGCGHPICKAHIEYLETPYCPCCKSKTPKQLWRRNYFLKRILGSTPKSCKNIHRGCDYMGNDDSLFMHEASCSHKLPRLKVPSKLKKHVLSKVQQAFYSSV